METTRAQLDHRARIHARAIAIAAGPSPDAIRAFRARLGWSQAALGKHLGRALRTVTSWEQARTTRNARNMPQHVWRDLLEFSPPP